MKKSITKVLALVLALVFCAGVMAACGNSSGETTTAAPETTTTKAAETTTAAPETTAEETEAGLSGDVIVFAAASMKETLTEIGEVFTQDNPDVNLIFTFDSSGTLKTQIEEGADCDIFISAGQKQMNQLDIEADPSVNTDGLDFVDTATRFNLLENKVVLAVPDGNPKEIESFDQLAELLVEDGAVMMAMGNEDVPVGQYTQKILAYYNIDETAISGNITYGSNVKEVTTQVSEATVDCGVVYATDAFSAGLEWVDEATKDMCGQIIYPAAMLKEAPNPEAAAAFLEFIKSDEASEILESVGFTPLS